MDFLKFHPRFSGNRDSGANLKKVLALVLAFACAFTMFAGAAFTDSADIKVDTEVVDTLVSLGVVNGYDDGSFKPNGTVTRAEMAKMIYVLRTGNSDASAYNDDKTSFTDIGSHWARGYIKYCQSLGIIAGKSNTKFVPNEKVSAQEAAKMLLVTLGYNAQKAGLVGTGWASKTNALADENGLLEDVNTSFTSACPRQYAAQLIYNAIDAYTVVLRDGEYTNMKLVTGIGGNDYNPTIGEKYMGLNTQKGILVASGKTGINAQKTSKEDSLAVNVADSHGHYDYTVDKTFTKVKGDYTALLGQEVKVMYKDTDDVYGVFATDKNNTVVTTLGDIDLTDSNKKLKVDGEKYDLKGSYTTVTSNDTRVSENNTAFASVQSKITGNAASTVTLIDNDDDDKLDVIVVTKPVAVAKVTFVGSDSVTISGQGSYDFDDENIYEGIKKNDFAVVYSAATTKDGKVNIVKADIVSGKVTGVRGSDVQVGGNWYTKADAMTGDNVELDSTYDFAIMGGYLYNANKTKTGSSDDVIYVAEIVPKTGLGADKKADAKIYKADGTTANVVVSKIDGADAVTSGAVTTGATNVEGKLYTYELDDDEYELKTVSASNIVSYDLFASDSTDVYDAGKFAGTYKFADDAIVFVGNSSDKDATVKTGKQVKAWGDDSSDKFGAKGMALVSKENGVNYVKVACIVDATDAPTSSDVKYGYVTEKSYTTKIGSDNYVVYKFWNGSENVTGYEKSSSIVASKGEFISYKVDKDTFEDGAKIKSVTAITNKSAITEYDNDKYIQISGVASSVDTVDKDDTTVIYVDTKNVKGANGSIVVAEEKADGAYAKNVVYSFTRGKDYFDVLFVDVNNQLYKADSDDKEADVAAPVYTATSSVLVNNVDGTNNVTITPNKNTGIKKGDVITLTATPAATLSATKDVVINITITPADGSEVITRTVTLKKDAATTDTATATFTMPAANVTITAAVAA